MMCVTVVLGGYMRVKLLESNLTCSTCDQKKSSSRRYTPREKKKFTTNVSMITLSLMKEALIENAEGQGKLILDSVLCTSNITTASKHTSIHNVYSKWSTFFICFRYSKFHYYLRVLCCCASQLAVNIPHGQQVLRGRPCQTTWVH